jgi:hypothetical protein
MCEECSHNIMESFLVFLYFNALMDFVLNVVKTLCSVWFDLKAYKILTLNELVYLVIFHPPFFLEFKTHIQKNCSLQQDLYIRFHSVDLISSFSSITIRKQG